MISSPFTLSTHAQRSIPPCSCATGSVRSAKSAAFTIDESNLSWLRSQRTWGPHGAQSILMQYSFNTHSIYSMQISDITSLKQCSSNLMIIWILLSCKMHVSCIFLKLKLNMIEHLSIEKLKRNMDPKKLLFQSKRVEID